MKIAGWHWHDHIIKWKRSTHYWPFVREILRLAVDHDDVIKWKHFPRWWPFVRGIHRSPVNSPHKGPLTRSFDIFYLRLIKRLSKHSRGWWFETLSRPLWRHCNEWCRAPMLTLLWAINCRTNSRSVGNLRHILPCLWWPTWWKSLNMSSITWSMWSMRLHISRWKSLHGPTVWSGVKKLWGLRMIGHRRSKGRIAICRRKGNSMYSWKQFENRHFDIFVTDCTSNFKNDKFGVAQGREIRPNKFPVLVNIGSKG